ncbi:hypothetical protein Dda_0554 [Drechslerella dactyloides]|uniref:Nucleoporin NSP1 n=1 Tax=Drechslerella dactyloides TaxID=74499 RepID=A0AAD6J4Q0_DREDA|nr:hypothetical protein Dda_0554 [Drechslerella dactyloides]
MNPGPAQLHAIAQSNQVAPKDLLHLSTSTSTYLLLSLIYTREDTNRSHPSRHDKGTDCTPAASDIARPGCYSFISDTRSKSCSTIDHRLFIIHHRDACIYGLRSRSLPIYVTIASAQPRPPPIANMSNNPSIFGQSTSSIFGSSTTGTGTSGENKPNLFGTANTPASSGQTNLFGQTAGTPTQSTASTGGAGLFGGAATPASSGNSIFGKSATSLFGASTNTPGASTPTGTSSTPSIFGASSTQGTKSTNTFSFGSTQAATPAGSQTPTQSGTTGSNFFSGSTTPAANRLAPMNSGNMFGQSTTPAQPPPASLSGSGMFAASTGAAPADANKSGNLFGGTSNTSLFGSGAAKPGAAPSGTASSLFSAGSQGAATPTNSSMFPSQASGAAPAASAADSAKAVGSSIFGTSTASTAGNLFGGAKPSTPAPSGTVTPSAGANLFGAGSGASNLFTSQAAASSVTPSAQSIFGAKTETPKPTAAGLFGLDASKPAAAASIGAGAADASKPANLFGGPMPTPGGQKPASLFGPGATPSAGTPTTATPTDAQKPAMPASLFGGGATRTPATPTSATSLFSTGPGATGQGATGQPGNLFGTPGTAKPAGAGMFNKDTPSATTATKPSIFPTGTPATTTTATGAAPAAAPASLFGPKPTDAKPTTPAATTQAQAGSLFSASTAAASSAAAPASATATTQAAAPGASLFGKPPQPAAAAADANKPATAPATAAAAAALAQGPVGTQPPQPSSRLKNKSMDEMISRWTSDLEKYSTEFNKQATEIASWDRMLVTNGDKLVELHAETIKATKKQEDITKALDYVVGQQEELAAALELYEKQVDDIFQTQIGGPEGMQPADQEREKSYLLAEKLDKQLDIMSKNLGNIITDINNATSTINKTSNTEDPLATIVKILNNHLGALQEIDVRSNALQGKIDSARTTREASMSNNGLGGQDMNDFFASQAFRGMR